jgi:sugar transferase (PEP-CTERM system associated)
MPGGTSSLATTTTGIASTARDAEEIPLRGGFVAASSVRQTILAFSEGAILVGSVLVAAALRFRIAPYESILPKALLFAFVVQACFYFNQLYEDLGSRRQLELILRLIPVFALSVVLLAVIYYMVPSVALGRGLLGRCVPLGFGGILVWRGFFLWMSGQAALTEAVLIVGTGQSAQQIVVEILKRAPLGFRVVGFLGEHKDEVGRSLVNLSVIGTVGELVSIVDRHNVRVIVVALDDRRGKMPVSELLRCRLRGVRVEEAPNFYERLTGKILLKNLRPSWLVFSQGFNKPRLLRTSKQVAEFTAALVLLLVTAPLMLLIAALIKLGSPGPVLYRQERVGEGGRPFMLFKFRTMRPDAEAISGPVWASEDQDPRVTPMGRKLRKMRLDELPQLFNVLRGEMSFVGPRPERPHFVNTLSKVIPFYHERHGVRPGITGWAQIKFRYGSTIEDAEEKLQFDLYYIKHMSIAFDLGIVLDTLKVVLLEKGAR